MNNIYILSPNKTKIDNVNYLNIFDINCIQSDIDLYNYDVLLYTSKNAIYAIDSFNKQYKDIDSFVISKKTSQVLKEYGVISKFVGTKSNGDDFANEIKDLLNNKKVLYIRAKKTVNNLCEILNNNNIVCDELIAYETVCKEHLNENKPEKNSVIIFSSPSTIKCFFDNFKWDDSYKAILIGKTTAKFFPKNIKYDIAKETTLQACVDLARMI